MILKDGKKADQTGTSGETLPLLSASGDLQLELRKPAVPKHQQAQTKPEQKPALRSQDKGLEEGSPARQKTLRR